MASTLRIAVVGLVLIQACATSSTRPGEGPDALYAVDSPAGVPLAEENALPPVVPYAILPSEAPAPPSGVELDSRWDQEDPPASVAEAESPWEKFSLTAGVLLVALDSRVRFGPAGLGVQVNLEDLLGFDTSTTSARLGGSWRFTENRRHRVDLTWVDLGRNGKKTLEQDLDLGNGTILPAGTGVKSNLSVSLIKTEYSYSFFQDERIDLAAAAGLYVAPIGFELAASGFSTFEDSFSVTAPLPLLGIRADFEVTPKWFLRSDLSLFYLEVNEYQGTMTDITTAVEYKPWKNFAFGLGIDAFSLGVERNGSTSVPGVGFRGAVEFEYIGLILYLKGLW